WFSWDGHPQISSLLPSTALSRSGSAFGPRTPFPAMTYPDQAGSTTCRPAYCPHTGQATLRGLSSLHARFGHGTRCTGAAFHCERRDRVFERDIFRFGTATVTTPQVSLMGTLGTTPWDCALIAPHVVTCCLLARTRCCSIRKTVRQGPPTEDLSSHGRDPARDRPTSDRNRGTDQGNPGGTAEPAAWPARPRPGPPAPGPPCRPPRG